MKLPRQHRHHVDPGHGLLFNQRYDVVAVHLEAGGILDRNRIRLVRCLVQHRSKTEELSMHRLMHDHLLLIFVDGGHFDRATEQDVGTLAGVIDFVDPLPRHKGAKFYLAGQNAKLIFIQEGK